jgi:hypothetical protein
VQSEGQSIVTSRSVPQQTAQMVSPFAGQNLLGGRFSQIGQAKALFSSRNKVSSARNSHYATEGAVACRHRSCDVPAARFPNRCETSAG